MTQGRQEVLEPGKQRTFFSPSNPCLIDMPECIRLSLRIAPDRIHFLKFILEGYDNLAVVSTLDAPAGIVEVRCPEVLEAELAELLSCLDSAIGRAPHLNAKNG